MFDNAHASMQIPVRPPDAAAVADHWRGQLGRAPVRRFVRPAARLWLWDGSSSSEPDPTPVRPMPGVLWVRGRPVWVYLELSAWSATSTTVAIRPRRLSLLIGTQRYATAVHRALDGIAEGLRRADEALEDGRARLRCLPGAAVRRDDLRRFPDAGSRVATAPDPHDRPRALILPSDATSRAS